MSCQLNTEYISNFYDLVCLAIQTWIMCLREFFLILHTPRAYFTVAVSGKSFNFLLLFHLWVYTALHNHLSFTLLSYFFVCVYHFMWFTPLVWSDYGMIFFDPMSLNKHNCLFCIQIICFDKYLIRSPLQTAVNVSKALFECNFWC